MTQMNRSSVVPASEHVTASAVDIMSRPVAEELTAPLRDCRCGLVRKRRRVFPGAGP